MHCQHCGQFNAQASNFCRFCGTKFKPAPQFNAGGYNPQPNPAPVNFEDAPRRPYSWKTDEYQLPEDKTPKTKPIDRVPPLPNFQQSNPHAAMQTFQHGQQAIGHNYHCPRCGSNLLPVMTRQISTAGWIVFALLLIFTFFFFWIGLLIKEDVRVCPVCNFKYPSN